MKKTLTHRIILLFLLSGFLLTLTSTSASAQSGLRAVLSAPDLAQFPSVTTYLDVYDSLGNFVSDLDVDQFTLQENGIERTINEATRIEPGLHTIFALNLGPTLNNRLASDDTRYEDIVTILGDWLNSIPGQASNLYSFTSDERAFVQRSGDPQELLQTLQAYQPNLYNFEPDLASLSFALDVAAQQPQSASNAKQIIFYITPLPVDSDLTQIPVLAAQAADIHTPVYVWLIADESSSNSKAAEVLRDLASTTGGKFFLYSDEEETPDPETYLAPLRYTYRIRYTSAINQSGFHDLQMLVERGVQQAQTQAVSFQIDLLPPEVTIIALPPQISMVWIDSEEGDKVLKPDFITLQISVNFPDGYSRQLRYSRLLVDGEEIILLDQQPFEWLGWPLNGYRMTGTHTVVVEVEDILGFRTTSTIRTVEIIVEQRYTGFWGGLVNFTLSGGWILYVALSILAGIAVYISYRRRNPRFAPAGAEPAISFSEDPLTQQIDIPIEPSLTAAKRPVDVVELVPRLFPLSEEYSLANLDNAGITLAETEIRIGSDPEQAELVLNHPSISPLHARIRRSPQGTIILADMGSDAGTWVNYAPVSKKGTVLQNNDLIHFGEVAYRFELTPYRRKISPLNE